MSLHCMTDFFIFLFFNRFFKKNAFEPMVEITRCGQFLFFIFIGKRVLYHRWTRFWRSNYTSIGKVNLFIYNVFKLQYFPFTVFIHEQMRQINHERNILTLTIQIIYGHHLKSTGGHDPALNC